MLINSKVASRHSAVFELGISAVLVFSVGIAVYQMQHPHVSQAQRVFAALQQ